MTDSSPAPGSLDLTQARAVAEAAAQRWGVRLEPPFPMANVSYVAPAGAAVVKVAWEGDDQSLHEPDALELWDGDGAVRLLARHGRALLEEQAIPGEDISALPESVATTIAVDLANRLWRPASPPFRPVAPFVQRWLEQADCKGSELVVLARELLAELEPTADWLVHGDLHHHNILRHGGRYVAIDPKPYAADREYDIPSFLWNPMTNLMDDPDQLERRVAAFVEAGLSDFRIRAWTVIRGAYLRPQFAAPIIGLIDRA